MKFVLLVVVFSSFNISSPSFISDARNKFSNYLIYYFGILLGDPIQQAAQAPPADGQPGGTAGPLLCLLLVSFLDFLCDECFRIIGIH